MAGGDADVAALGVEEDEEAQVAGAAADVLEGAHAGPAEALEARGLRLDHADVLGGGFHRHEAELAGGLGLGAGGSVGLGHLCRVGVEPETEGRARSVDGGAEHVNG